MALEDTLVTELMVELVSVTAKKIGMPGVVDKELRKLKDSLEMIAAVTYDAEKKQVKDKVVQLWLKRLQDVAYDADDLLDEISYEAIRLSVKKHGMLDKVRGIFNFGFRKTRKIKIINRKIDGISKQKDMFQLEHGIENYQNTDPLDRMTFSFVDDYKIVGREKDKSCIIEILLMTKPSSSYGNSSSPENVSVVSVVGMGGVGKTTLAQLVYKDHSIMRSFELRAWVCISDDFDIFLILKNILESITGRKCDDFSNVGVLVKKVEEEISGKKYLLVLDDLWNENAEDWEKLKSYLSGGAQGSKILVTTRKENVASIVRCSIPPYNLRILSKQECWSIIKSRAFSAGGAVETPTMLDIGEEIARKSGGLPLTANSLGNLMRLRRKESDWLSIRDNDVFNTPESPNKILLILKLSYGYLSSRSKKCFSYCSLFPKDYKLDRETLILLWMAEGFLHPSTGGNRSSLEDTGNDCFLSLLSSSLFVNVEKDEFGEITSFQMHDLVHDLALSVAGSHEVTTLKASEIENDASHIRRLQLIVDEKEEEIFLNTLKNARKLRTIFWQDEGYLYPSLLSNKRLRVIHRLGTSTLQTISFPLKFKHLRYLDLSYSNIEDVHAASVSQLYNLQMLKLNHGQNVQNVLDRIGSLKNLRHLDISSSDAKVLPDSIAGLTNLKTLDIRSCLNISVLPENVGSLQNLLCLDLEGTAIEVLPESCILGLCNLEIVRLGSQCKLPREVTYWRKLRRLTHGRDEDEMPRGIEELTRIQELRSYLVRKEEDSNNSSGIKELASLNSLQLLIIRNLENVTGQRDAECACLNEKPYIHRLHLIWSSSRSDDDDDSMVLEGLQPHPNLKELKIERFHGSKLPRWMGLSYCLPNLVELCLFECNRCDKLPGLGLLPCLTVLRISGMNSVKSLGEELYYQEEGESSSSSTAANSTIYSFPSLLDLDLDGMESLVEWVPSLPPPYYPFPLLKSLSIKKCPRLRTTSISFPSLKSLELEDLNDKEVKTIVAGINIRTLRSIWTPKYKANFTL